MDSLLDFNFSEDSQGAYDYSSDLLLSDEFNSISEDASPILLQPKIEDADYLMQEMSTELPLEENVEDVFSTEQPPLPSEGVNMDIFELSFVPEDLDFEVKSEPLPLHCAPLSEPTAQKLSAKRQANRKTVKQESKRARIEEEPVLVKVSRPARPHHTETRKDDEKYQKRLVANKKSAQASRERKKALRMNLEDRVNSLSEENISLALEMEKLESDNKDLKEQFDQLQKVLSNKVSESSTLLSELMTEKPAEDAAASGSSASMYLMLVLYSMSQYLKTGTTNTTLPITTTHVPSPLFV